MDDSLRLHARTARAGIEAGTLRGPPLRAEIETIPLAERDAWVNDILGFGEPPPDAPLPRGAVPYLPCGVDEILALVREVPLGPSDLLADLGAGVGRVVILAHLLTGARGRGIEIQEHLVTEARARCVALGLRGVTFDHANVVDAELDGSVFFMYAPFNGEMLRAVLERIASVARRRSILIATVDLELDESWLRPRLSSCTSLRLYDSVSGARDQGEL